MWLMAGIGAVVIAIVLMAITLGLRDDSPNDPTPTAEDVSRQATSTATVTPTATSTATVTPSPTVTIATPAVAQPTGSLTELLGYAPDRLSNDDIPLPFVAGYADIAGWTDAQGLTMPTGLDDPGLVVWERSLQALSLPTSLETRGTEELWQETYGFDLTRVDQVLMVGAAPDSILIMRGRFDERTLLDAWASSGYQAVQVEGVTIWSLWPGDEIALTAPASRPALGSLNNIVLLPDGTLVAAAKLSQLKAVLRVVNGDADSLAEQDDVQDLLALDAVDALLSAVIEKGDFLATIPQDGADEASARVATAVAAETKPVLQASTPETDVAMPTPELVLIGLVDSRPVTASTVRATPIASPAGEDDAAPTLLMALVFDDADDAGTGVTLVTDRLRDGRSSVTGRLYRARVADATVMAGGSDRDVLVLDATLANGAADWLQMMEERDFGFAFWEDTP